MRFTVSTIITHAALNRKMGIPAVLIFRNVEVVARMVSGVPIIATKWEDKLKRVTARTIENRRIIVSDVFI